MAAKKLKKTTKKKIQNDRPKSHLLRVKKSNRIAENLLISKMAAKKLKIPTRKIKMTAANYVVVILSVLAAILEIKSLRWFKVILSDSFTLKTWV